MIQNRNLGKEQEQIIQVTNQLINNQIVFIVIKEDKIYLIKEISYREDKQKFWVFEEDIKLNCNVIYG